MGERRINLEGYRILVVGASSGIGREVGIQAAQAGAHVAFAARRADRLEEAAAKAGGRSFAVTCDVRDEEQCRAAVEEAAGRFGGLDAVIYGSGMSPLVRINEADAELWRTLFETNVIGASQIARAAMAHLERSGGRMMFLGSSSVGRPYPGLVAYTTSKAALHEMARGWRNECPHMRITTFIVGPTVSEFANEWDQDLAVEMFGRWSVEGYPAGAALSTEQMANEILWVVASDVRVEEILVMPDPGSLPAGLGETPTDLPAS